MVYGKDVLRSQAYEAIVLLGGMQFTKDKLLTIARKSLFNVDSLNRYEFNEFVEYIKFVIGTDKVNTYYVSELLYMISYMLEWFEDNQD